MQRKISYIIKGEVCVYIYRAYRKIDIHIYKKKMVIMYIKLGCELRKKLMFVFIRDNLNMKRESKKNEVDEVEKFYLMCEMWWC